MTRPHFRRSLRVGRAGAAWLSRPDLVPEADVGQTWRDVHDAILRLEDLTTRLRGLRRRLAEQMR